MTIKGLLLVVAAIAVVLALHVNTAGMVTRQVLPKTYSGIIALSLLAVSCYCSWQRSDCPNAFWIAILAWYFALIDILWRLISTFSGIHGMQLFFLLRVQYEAILTGITLPFLCSIPPVYLLLSRIEKPLSLANIRFATAAMVALVDIAIIELSIVALFGTHILSTDPL